ncbi:hypothetical protein [Actinokineospora spheciospongiae]|uniref:hypothetical protein n=1 Tax=Actinokineospora spheciospongiae TaxID=909613 RepID=UPI000D71BA40|nr:hypothetical protein [Actinokineospora spheciospongiae]PWW59504.1 hypothetical protein DFQ13_108141 [Actinokineospora spheciospongiae]
MDTSAAGRVGVLVATALNRVDRIAGTRPSNRPPHLAQLTTVLQAAVAEARTAEDHPKRVGRDADLWRLREPGYLRGIVEHPVSRAGSGLVLLPVVLTWVLLGAAEFLYVREYVAVPVGSRPSFFADWLAQPWYRGPFVLSAVIVLTVVWIMLGYRGPAREQAAADELDRVVHQLEVDLLPPLTVLRSRLAPASPVEVTRQAAADLTAASAKFAAATDTLATAASVVDRLAAVVERLAAAVPDLRAQADRLADLDGRLERSVAETARQVKPMTDAVEAVTSAAATAADTTSRSEAVLKEATTRLDEAAALATRTAEHQSTLATAREPFTEAATAVASAATKLDTAASATRDTAARLGEVIKDVNWLTMVADGLRHPDHR